MMLSRENEPRVQKGRRGGQGSLGWTDRHLSRRFTLWFCLVSALLITVQMELQAWPSEGGGEMVRTWLGADGKALPFGTNEEVEEFLLTATVMEAQRVGAGVNNPWKLTLEKNGIQVHGCFRDVNIIRQNVQMSDGFRSRLQDDATFEVAAYRLSRLLGIENVPPVVLRKFRGVKGTLQLWMENTLTEKKRLQKQLKPTDTSLWRDQYETMVIFDSLIGNTDRNQGNILFDRDWNRWLIDHTRAFETETKVKCGSIKRCDPDLFDRLLELDEPQLKESLGDVLTGWQIRSLLKRRDMIVEHLQERIDEFGVNSILAEFASLY